MRNPFLLFTSAIYAGHRQIVENRDRLQNPSKLPSSWKISGTEIPCPLFKERLDCPLRAPGTETAALASCPTHAGLRCRSVPKTKNHFQRVCCTFAHFCEEVVCHSWQGSRAAPGWTDTRHVRADIIMISFNSQKKTKCLPCPAPKSIPRSRLTMTGSARSILPNDTSRPQT